MTAAERVCPRCSGPDDHGDECRTESEQKRRPASSGELAAYCDPHRYFGDDGDVGRCYCGRRTYPLGGVAP